ncbi:hypothetical protein ACPTG1_29590, partial [Pseudomonas aeruginosa]
PSAVVEGGSSGSGLLSVAGDGSYQLRGGLYGGPSYCGAPTTQRNDYFSDFSGVYSQISRYFAPCGQPGYRSRTGGKPRTGYST